MMSFCHLLRVGPSVDIDDEGVFLGLGEVGRKIKTNLTTYYIKLVWDLFTKGSNVMHVKYLGLVLAAIHRNVQIGHLRCKHSVIDCHPCWQETFGRDLTARSEESLALSTSRLILSFGFVSYMYTWQSSVASGATIQVIKVFQFSNKFCVMY